MRTLLYSSSIWMHLEKRGLHVVYFLWNPPRRRSKLAVLGTCRPSFIFWQVLVKDDREITQSADHFTFAVNLSWSSWCSSTCEQHRKTRLVSGDYWQIILRAWPCSTQSCLTVLICSFWMSNDLTGRGISTPWWSGAKGVVVSSRSISV